MRTSTLASVLLLRRAAILDAFNSRWSLAVGALFVLSAGLARNYDGEDLLAEPWWLAAPFAASVVTSLVLWLLFIIWARVPGPSLWRLYPRFLGVYWLTAPLAWLYAIPYERLLEPAQAVEANAYTLLLVSSWRVLIITRVLSVLFGARLPRTLVFTLAFGAAVMFAATLFGPKPVLDVMGGLRLPPEDRARAGLLFTTGLFSLIASVVLIPAAAILAPAKGSTHQPPAHLRSTAGGSGPETNAVSATRRSLPVGVLVLSLFAVLVWLPALVLAQPEQRNRRRAESHFTTRDYAGMISELSRHGPADYPPHWRLPTSHFALHQRAKILAELLPHIDSGAAGWVRSGYVEIARDSLIYHPFGSSRNLGVEQILENPDLFDEQQGYPGNRQILRWLTENDPSLTADLRAKLIELLKPAAEPTAPPP